MGLNGGTFPPDVKVIGLPVDINNFRAESDNN